MAEERGTKELEELLTFVVALIEAVSESLEDGKIGLTDLLKFFGAFRKAAPAFSGMSDIKAEIADLSEDEKKGLSQHVAHKLDLDNDKIEQYIEQGLAVVISLMDLLPMFKSK